MRVSEQLMEVLILHKGMSKSDAFEESVRMLEAVKIPEARKRINEQLKASIKPICPVLMRGVVERMEKPKTVAQSL